MDFHEAMNESIDEVKEKLGGRDILEDIANVVPVIAEHCDVDQADVHYALSVMTWEKLARVPARALFTKLVTGGTITDDDREAMGGFMSLLIATLDYLLARRTGLIEVMSREKEIEVMEAAEILRQKIIGKANESGGN